MKKVSFLLSIVLGALFCAMPLQSQAQAADKATVKFWKNKAKGYVKNPLALKAEFENYQNQIKDLKDRNKKLVEQLNAGGGVASGDKSLVDSLRWAIIQLEGDLQSTKNNYAKLEAAYKTQKKVSEMGIRTGLIYGVQVGAFVFYEMQNPPVDAQDVIVERAEGFNKYVLGNFRTYDEASSFRDELAKIGVKGPWVVPYIDGVRVTIEEAKEYSEKQGNF